MPLVTIDGVEYEVVEMTGGEDLHITQESTIWDRVTNRPRVDIEKYTFGIMLASIKSWGRKDSEEKPVPITRESLSALPRTLFGRLATEVTKVNFPEQSANFRE